MPPLDPDPVVIYESDRPKRVYPRSPAILRLDDGRLVVTMEHNLGATRAIKDMRRTPEGKPYRGWVMLSDDAGKTWRKTDEYPLIQARPFEAGDKLYLLGHQGDLGIAVSEDRGETWSEVSWLTQEQEWHQAPCNVRYAHGKVYLVMERVVPPTFTPWPVEAKAPVVMAAPMDADLLKRESWTFSSELPFRELIREVGRPNGIGVPFFFPGPTIREFDDVRESRPMAPPGWLETHLLTFPDPDHQWHDPQNLTMYLYARAHTGMTNLAAIAKATEHEDGSITVEPVKAPSRRPIVYIPLPGGQLKFYILYDEVSALYWLVSNQSTDSMTLPSALPDSRYSLPENERHRLVLHFSKNAMDWIFAGLVDKADDPRQARSYPSMAVDGDDLVVVSRSGNEHAKNAHDGNMVLFHRIKDFRGLVY